MSKLGELPARIVAHSDVAHVAAAIAATLTVTSQRWPMLPEAHATERTGVRVLANDHYDVWLLRWPPGTGVEPHDHGPSAGGLAVVTGTLEEIRWHGGRRTSTVVLARQSVAIERGVVHDVIGGPDGAMSVHVYAPPLREMTFYDPTGTVAIRHEVVNSDAMVPREGDDVSLSAPGDAARPSAA